jgi:general secretion pathway protein F
MPVFAYCAKASPTEIVAGEMAAESAEVLAARLFEKGLHPLEIARKEELRHSATGARGFFSRRAAKRTVVLFTRQVAHMLEAGMNLHAALRLLVRQSSLGPLLHVARDLAERVREGQKFSEACAAWPKIFSAFYVSMIAAGEAGGMLELVLQQLADFLEKEDDLRQQVRVVLAYPLLMLAMGAATVVLLLAFVVPRMVSMFDEMGQTLPLPTRILIAVSAGMASYWWLLLLAGIFLRQILQARRGRPEFQIALDAFKLRMPFLGPLQVEAEVAQFARTMSALLARGVPVHRAFDVVLAACKNLVLKTEFQAAAEAVRRGAGLGAGFARGRHLPALFGQMLTIAEETNQLEIVLEKIAAASAKEVERRVTLFTKLLEPAMIILVGAVIGFVVFAMMLPIFQMDFVVQ